MRSRTVQGSISFRMTQKRLLLQIEYVIWTITVVGNMEEITLNFENHEPFRFKLNHLEIKQPSNGKYYVNDGQSGQQINILFLDNRQ